MTSSGGLRKKPDLLKEQLLRNIASDLGNEWESIASYLGISYSELDRLKRDNATTENQIFAMLLSFKRKKGSSIETVKLLCKTLEKVGRNDILAAFHQDDVTEEMKLPGTESAEMLRELREYVESLQTKISELSLSDTPPIRAPADHNNHPGQPPQYQPSYPYPAQPPPAYSPSPAYAMPAQPGHIPQGAHGGLQYSQYGCHVPPYNSNTVNTPYNVKNTIEETSKPETYSEVIELNSGPQGVAFVSGDVIAVADEGNQCVRIMNASGEVKTSFGSYALGGEYFTSPTGVCINNRGHIVVSDHVNNCIHVWDKNGQFLRKFGSKGQKEDELYYPAGVACDADDNIYVCDTCNHSVKVFTSDGEFLRRIGSQGKAEGQFCFPSYLAINQDKIIVSDRDNHCIQIFSLDGEFHHKFGKRGKGLGQFKSPNGIAVDKQGRIVVADSDNNRIQILDMKGTCITTLGKKGSKEGQLKWPEDVTVLTDGRIVVSEVDNKRLQIFTHIIN
ncbi:uncharacterized protein [Antedon mediterranea]|uniref:uncharacterized protein n=1 Tax=Antedon mediterranea TaxID=105859 RepID=UPI003AF6F0B4